MSAGRSSVSMRVTVWCSGNMRGGSRPRLCLAPLSII